MSRPRTIPHPQAILGLLLTLTAQSSWAETTPASPAPSTTTPAAAHAMTPAAAQPGTPTAGSFATPPASNNSDWKKNYRMEAGISAPQPLQLGIERITDLRLRPFATLGIFGLPLGERSFLVYGLQGGLRWSPSASDRGLYAAVALGYQRIRASAVLSALKVEGETLADAAILRLASVFALPAVGYVFKLGENFTIGSELGIQIPLFGFGDLYLKNDATGENSDNSSVLRVKSSNYISRISSLPLPQLTLVRLSWSL